jgi:hypothetical protein
VIPRIVPRLPPGGQPGNPSGIGPEPGNTGGGEPIIASAGFETTAPGVAPGVHRMRVIGGSSSVRRGLQRRGGVRVLVKGAAKIEIRELGHRLADRMAVGI